MEKDLFVPWKLLKASDEDGLAFYLTYDYALVSAQEAKAYDCVLPLTYVQDLVAKHDSPLSVFRTLRMRPREPHELVSFLRIFLGYESLT